jgi:hypothetical protein
MATRASGTPPVAVGRLAQQLLKTGGYVFGMVSSFWLRDSV